MSAVTIDKWASLDWGRTAHWWLGNEGTACGRDFRLDIQRAYADDPRCRKCTAYLATTDTSPSDGEREGGRHG